MRKTPSSITCVLLCSFALLSCKGSDDEDTGAGDTSSDTSSSAGDGDGDGDGDPTTSDCPPGTFDCPCDNGMCVPGLTCGMDGLCSLGGDPGEMTTTTTTTGGTTTGGGASDPYNPENCEAPSELLQVELLQGSFCSAPCVEDSECPDGPPGTEGLCTISTNGSEPNFCALLCTPGEEACPEGGACEEIPQQPGFGLCTY